jgi:hypothetical protein
MKPRDAFFLTLERTLDGLAMVGPFAHKNSGRVGRSSHHRKAPCEKKQYYAPCVMSDKQYSTQYAYSATAVAGAAGIEPAGREDR